MDKSPNWISLLVALNYEDLPSRIREHVSQEDFVSVVKNAVRDFSRLKQRNKLIKALNAAIELVEAEISYWSKDPHPQSSQFEKQWREYAESLYKLKKRI